MMMHRVFNAGRGEFPHRRRLLSSRHRCVAVSRRDDCVRIVVHLLQQLQNSIPRESPVALVRKSEGRCISNKTASAQFLNRVCLTEVS